MNPLIHFQRHMGSIKSLLYSRNDTGVFPESNRDRFAGGSSEG